jgi:hypothetical protein
LPSSFADTSRTKFFVGGLAWWANGDRLHHFYKCFGDILEVVPTLAAPRDMDVSVPSSHSFLCYFLLLGTGSPGTVRIVLIFSLLPR